MNNLARKEFIHQSQIACNNAQARITLKKNLNNYYVRYKSALNHFKNLETAKRRIHYFKAKTIENLDNYLIEFDKIFSLRGGKVIYASRKEEALDYILSILKQHGVQKVVKSKSIVCEEIGLSEFLRDNKIKVTETNLGCFLASLVNEKSTHLKFSITQKSFKEIIEILNDKYNQSFTTQTSVEIVVKFIRQLIRDEYSEADAGITGANFLVADIGAVAISEDEANAILTASFPPIHIVVTSIEKVISSINQLDLYQSMLAASGDGSRLTTYNHLFFGPSTTNEINTVEKMYVVVIDNNRTEILKNLVLREAMYCIKCGACISFCPVYRTIGGTTYKSVYSGPIGSILSPYIFNREEYMHLPFSSTLCGKCNEVCPLNIDLKNILIECRRQIVENKLLPKKEHLTDKYLFFFMSKRKRLDKIPSFVKNLAIKAFFKKSWGTNRELPTFAKYSYFKARSLKK